VVAEGRWAEGKRFARGSTITSADVDVSHLMHDRRTMNTATNADQPYAVRKAVATEWMVQRELLRTPSAHPFVPSNTHERDERAQEIIEIQAQGLATRLLSLPESHRKVVLGLSGGLDSTLALLVAIHACDILGLDYKNIHTVTMPGFGSSDETQSDADVMAAAFGTTHSHIPIVDIATQELTMLDHPLDRHDITFENVQARARTNLLFNYSNQVGGLVLGTGDLSELALGWCTFNADHMSQYNVNTSIPKTLVKHLVQWASEQDFVTSVGADKPINAILARRFSPELIPPVDGKIQDTEDSIGDYELHDFFIYYFNRFGDQPTKIAYLAEKAFDGVFDRRQILETLEIFFTRWFNNQWKRNVLPDGPKVGIVSYSPRGDLRMPPEASMRLWQDQVRAELASLGK
jgi:NAD+ synthase (glutamine-hydrolysing)